MHTGWLIRLVTVLGCLFLYSTVWYILLGLMRVWQRGQSGQARRVKHPNQTQPNPVTELVSHPVQYSHGFGFTMYSAPRLYDPCPPKVDSINWHGHIANDASANDLNIHSFRWHSPWKNICSFGYNGHDVHSGVEEGGQAGFYGGNAITVIIGYCDNLGTIHKV